MRTTLSIGAVIVSSFVAAGSVLQRQVERFEEDLERRFKAFEQTKASKTLKHVEVEVDLSGPNAVNVNYIPKENVTYHIYFT